MHTSLPGAHTIMQLHALDGCVNMTMPVRIESAHPYVEGWCTTCGCPAGVCTGDREPKSVDGKVLDATVDDDGLGFTITLEIPDGLLPVLDPDLPGIAWSVA